MKSRNIFLTVILMMAFLTAACGGSTNTEMMEETSTEDAMMQETPMADAMMNETPTEDVMMHETPTEDMMMHETPTADVMMQETSTEDAMMESPVWYGTSLTDIQTGKSFAIQDFKGKVVLVETMAVWCPTCLKQQEQIKDLHTNLGMRDDLISLSLDIDPNEDAKIVKSYLDQNGFDWLYAVSPAEATSEIASTLGNQFLNPPSAPIFVIDRHGTAHPMPFGLKSADDLQKFIQPFLDENM